MIEISVGVPGTGLTYYDSKLNKRRKKQMKYVSEEDIKQLADGWTDTQIELSEREDYQGAAIAEAVSRELKRLILIYAKDEEKINWRRENENK